MALDKLIQIHETNQRLEEINELKGDLPSVLYDQEIEFEKLEEMQKQSSLSLEELSKNLSNHQSSLTDYNNKLEKYNDQLLNVQNNKEYDAVLTEIDHLKTQISDVNSNISSINQEMEETETSIESNKPIIEELSEKISLNKNELSEKMSITEKEENNLNKNKEDLIKKIADDINFKEYHKMFKNYGQGMAHISRNSCSYCYTQLPPQTLVEIEFDKKIIRCPSCSVFLYHKNETE